MTLSPAWLDELRARTLLSSIIAPSVKLIRAGREWKACCPFHNEKTPSFTVNDDKGFYHCLAGETVVLTRGGRIRIHDLSGSTAEVLGPSGKWIPAPFSDFGKHRLWELALSRNGVAKSIFATSRHRWFIRGSTGATVTCDLRPGARLLTTTPDRRKAWAMDPTGIRHGLVFGDGTMFHGVYGTINLHGHANMALARWFPDQRAVLKKRGPDKLYLSVYGGRAFSGWKELPDCASDDAYLLGFLAGYLAADGHVAKDGTVMLHSARRDHLEAVRDIAMALGIVTYGLTTQKRLGLNGKISDLHRIHFANSTLVPEIFLQEEARRRFDEQTKAFDRLRWTVKAITPTDRIENVYCAQVPEDHAFALDDNILTGNCFGCGAHGDAIRFLTDQRGLPFMDAVKELAAKAGMDVPAPDPKAKERAELAASLTDVMAACQNWFAEQLQGIAGASARDYLTKRGIDPAQVARFGIGLAPDSRNALKRALASLGEDKLVETGMLIQPEEGGKEPYDRFRGRLMIPIRDQRGRVIAFGGRILGEGEPKYLNSPDTPLFDKGRTLYNIDRAGPASRQAKRLIVVEGYMDVIGLDRAGIAEAVAPNGTAVTEAQLERMWRLDPAPILCFDGDPAGRKAAIRAAMRALPHLGPERTLRFVELPAGQDPDDMVRTGGREAVEALLAEPEPLDQRLWRHERDSAPLATPEARAGLRQRLVEHSQAIGDPELRRLYRDQWLGQFEREFGSVRPPFRPGARQQNRFDKRTGKWLPPAPPASESARRIGRSGIDAATGRALLVGFAYYPQALTSHAEQLAHLPIGERSLSAARDRLVDAALSGEALDRQQLVTILQSVRGQTDHGRSLSSRGGFSFTRSDTEPERAVRDLGIAIDALAAEEEIGAALNEATERLKAGDGDAYDEQLRLRAAREQVRQRLASLVGTE